MDSTFVYAPGMAGPLPVADSLLTSWIVTWGAHGLWTNPFDVFDANIFYPLHHTLAFSEHLLAGAALILPMDAISSNPVRNNNVLLLATFVLGGSGTTWLVRELGGSWTAAVAAGTFAFFGPLRLAYIGHVHVLSLHWLPIALALLHRTWRTGSTGTTVALTAAIALQGLSSVYLGYYSAFALLIAVGMLWVTRCPAAENGRCRTILACALAAGVAAPVMIPYVHAREVFALGRDPGEAFVLSARGINYLGAFLDPLVHIRQRFIDDGWPIAIVGIGLTLFAMGGLWAGASPARGGRRVAIAYAGVALGMALISFGPVVQLRPSLESGWPGPHLLFARFVPGFEALRAPSRAAGIVVLAMSVLAAFGVDAFLRRVSPRRRRFAVCTLALLLVYESWHPRLTASSVTQLVARTPAEEWLEGRPSREPVLVLPFGIPDRDAAAMVRRARDWRPLVNGYSGFEPSGYYLRRTLAAFPDDASVSLLASLGVRWVLVEGAAVPGKRSPCNAEPRDDLSVAHKSGDDCVLEIRATTLQHNAPSGERVHPHRVTTSDGESLKLKASGALETAWSQPVLGDREGWVEIELSKRRELRRIELPLGSRFGLYPRMYRVDISDDGHTWRTLLDEPVAKAPLVDYHRDPEHLRVVVDLPPTATRFIRIVRPVFGDGQGLDIALAWSAWREWGFDDVMIWAAPDPLDLPRSGEHLR